MGGTCQINMTSGITRLTSKLGVKFGDWLPSLNIERELLFLNSAKVERAS